MDKQDRTQIVERLKTASSVLVTVSTNPSVDQLAGCIGLTLLLNKTGKHATAVFSGEVPDTIEFLQPEKTLEPNTDSLRDFIISLDKSKADKLRYKVEDTLVKIFITPYKQKITEDDLEFGQGDLNIDVVIALGVHKRDELDQAITAHGGILHDATIISINNIQSGDLGSINWVNPQASSLSEMIADIAGTLAPDSFDAQIATALLTGIVAETHRFGNDKAHPQTMAIAGKLISAGASPQLVADKLDRSTDGDAQELPKDELPEVDLQEQDTIDQTPIELESSSPVKEIIGDEDSRSKEEDVAVSYDKSDENKHIEEISIDNQGIVHEVDDLTKPPSQAAGSRKVIEPLPDSELQNSDLSPTPSLQPPSPPELSDIKDSLSQVGADQPSINNVKSSPFIDNSSDTPRPADSNFAIDPYVAQPQGTDLVNSQQTPPVQFDVGAPTSDPAPPIDPTPPMPTNNTQDSFGAPSSSGSPPPPVPPPLTPTTMSAVDPNSNNSS